MIYSHLKHLLASVLFMWSVGHASAVLVSAGDSHSCAVSTDGSASCWGANASGQLGNGLSQFSAIPVAVQGLSVGSVKDIRVGRDFSCALMSDQAVRCWGGITADQTMISVLGLPPATKIAAGATHACAITFEGNVYCWGDGSKGQMGAANVTSQTQNVAAKVPELTGAIQLSAGKDATCAVMPTGKIVCIGAGSQLEGAVSAPAATIQVPEIADGVDVALHDSHACALRSNGAVACWGSNEFGQLGSPASSEISIFKPREVVGLTPAQAVSVGTNFSCALLTDKKIQCWGKNDTGQLGNGNETVASKFVIGIKSATSISAGGRNACATVDNGSYVQCWGSNVNGVLGNGLCYTNAAYYPGYSGKPYLTNNLGICVNEKALTPYSVKGFDVRGDADLVMNWAERSLPSLFAMGEGVTHNDTSNGYFWRRYVGGHNLGVTANGTPRVFYIGPASNDQLIDLEELSIWTPLAK